MAVTVGVVLRHKCCTVTSLSCPNYCEYMHSISFYPPSTSSSTFHRVSSSFLSEVSIAFTRNIIYHNDQTQPIYMSSVIYMSAANSSIKET